MTPFAHPVLVKHPAFEAFQQNIGITWLARKPLQNCTPVLEDIFYMAYRPTLQKGLKKKDRKAHFRGDAKKDGPRKCLYSAVEP